MKDPFHGEYGKQMRQLISELSGEATCLNGGHVKVTFPNGKEVFTSSTPSDRRALLNARAEMERASGKKAKRGKSGSYKFRKATSFRKTAPSKISPGTEKGLERLEELEELDRKIRDLLNNPKSQFRKDAEDIVYRRTELARKLIKDGADVTEHYMEKP